MLREGEGHVGFEDKTGIFSGSKVTITEHLTRISPLQVINTTLYQDSKEKKLKNVNISCKKTFMSKY